MTGKLAAGVDLGGTRLRGVLSDGQGNFLASFKEKTDLRSARAIVEQIVRAIRSLCQTKNVEVSALEGVGIASTGPLDMRKGTLVNPTNLPFPQVPLTKPVGEELGVPVYLLNDCTAGVIGERDFGAGKGVDDLVYITIGTGIGGGAIVDGHLLLGKDGNAVEIGHLVVDPSGRLVCGCGKRGHWEAYCSGKNLPNFVRMRLAEMDQSEVRKSLMFKLAEGKLTSLGSRSLFEAVRAGDGLSLQLVEEVGVFNAIGIANVVNAYDPSLITMGGSVVLNNRELVMKPIEEHVSNYTRNRVPRILVTPLLEEVSLYGAVAAVLRDGRFNEFK
jgi:glucokinase